MQIRFLDRPLARACARACAAAALLGPAAVVVGPAAAGAEAASAAAPEHLPRYVPRPGAASSGPVRMLGSTSRGTHDESLSVAVIAPDHVGFTGTAQPTLYWFASGRIAGEVELTIQDEQATAPLVETRLKSARTAVGGAAATTGAASTGAAPAAAAAAGGLHAVSLRELGASLAPDRDYRWSISVVGDRANRSKDMITSGFIRRTGSSAAPGSVFELAEDGLWYDAIAQLGEQIARRPSDALLRRQRAALLRQVGLEAAAGIDAPE